MGEAEGAVDIQTVKGQDFQRAEKTDAEGASDRSEGAP